MTGISLPDGIAIDDPRPIAADAPYTFFLPHPAEIEAMQPGDMAQFIFRQTEGETEYDAERMWVRIERIVDGHVVGTLASTPFDMPLFSPGDPVALPITHMLAVYYADGHDAPQVEGEREYWERCFVDDCVVEGRSRADYLYREEPDMACEGDEYEDSGWRIRGTREEIAADEEAGRKAHYCALGVVLNADDKWLHLIDSPPDSHFRWDEERQAYIELR